MRQNRRSRGYEAEREIVMENGGSEIMKKFGAFIGTVIAVVMMTTVLSFAGADFKVDRTYPADGAKNTIKDNMCVKVYFNKDVGNASSKKANAKAFKITDSSGKEYPTRIFYDKEDSKYALILIDTTKVSTVGKGKYVIKDDTVYTCTIASDFVDNDGNRLGRDVTISFKTINQGRNTMIYMIMMALMFGGMMLFSFRQSKKSHDDDKEEKQPAFNPYKEAKRTGKSVEEVMAKHRREIAKKSARAVKEENTAADEGDGRTYKVKGPRPVAAAGSNYKTGRKAAAEARKAEAEARKKELKAGNYGKAQKKKKKR